MSRIRAQRCAGRRHGRQPHKRLLTEMTRQAPRTQSSHRAFTHRRLVRLAKPACRSRMIVPSSPEARSPGPSGPDRVLHRPGEAVSSAALIGRATSRRSCQWISSPTTPLGGPGAARPTALAAYAGGTQGVRAHMRDCGGLPGRAGGSGRCRGAHLTSAAAPAAKPAADLIRHVKLATSRRPVSARSRRGAGYRLGASASNSPSTRSAQSAAHTATTRRSASLSVCGEPTPRIFSAAPPLGPSMPRVRSRLAIAAPGNAGALPDT